MSDLPWEFEEPEPVEASHLVRVTCCKCGARVSALAAPGQERRARCAGCIGTSEAVPAQLLRQYVPAVGYPSHPRASLDESVCPVCRATSPKDKCNWQPAGSHPKPAVSSRDGVEGVYPSAVLKLAERAREASWEVRQQYARGCGVHGSTGRALLEAESFALIFYGHPMTNSGAYAVYRGGSWRSVNIAGMAIGGVSDLLHWLETGGRVNGEAHWFQHLRALEEDAVRRVEGIKRRNAEIKKLYAAGVSAGSLVQKYGLSEDQVIKIVTPAKSKKESGG